jgi:uncharacterized membrane protein (UPF0127 family)
VLAILCFASLLLVSCSDGDKEPPEGTIALKMTTTDGKTKQIFAEVADTNEERSVGLSNRTELDEDRGMLFLLPVRGLGFWMKDTLIPLSVAFIGPCGEIVFIDDMQPQTDTLHNTDKPYKYGLETNIGWFDDNGVTEGSVVAIPDEYKQPECG